jgi:hypothetical protein
VLKPVAETQVAFRDHPSTGRNIRMVVWNDFQVGDSVLMGRELMRLEELPRNPDDDAVYWGTGHPRNNTGARLAFLGTTPEHHPQGQAIQKVEVHPPGTSFPPGGASPVTLYYRNDDGGPGFEKDSMLSFDPPADGAYHVRIEDTGGGSSDSHQYHLVIRRPHPDFSIDPSTANPNIPRGGTSVLTLTARRLDGFNGPIEIEVLDLPPGVTATSARIERDGYAADLLFQASESAPAVSPASWKLRARARVGDEHAEWREHMIDPGGVEGGLITVAQAPNLVVTPSVTLIEIEPGQRVTMKLSVERKNGFTGRVPIEVRNLPRGVAVQNIGLNGVLITEKESERVIQLEAEPWAEPQERFFFAVANCEAAGTQHSAPPIKLVVKPASATAGSQ